MFKKSDLKNWTVRRTVKLMGDSSVDVDIKVMSGTDAKKVFAKVDNAYTVREMVTAIHGYADEKGKEQTLAVFLKEMSDQDAVMHAIATECSTAQYTAATKN